MFFFAAISLSPSFRWLFFQRDAAMRAMRASDAAPQRAACDA